MAPNSIDRGSSRAVRERRAYQMVLASGVSGAAFVVTTILWIAGAMGGLVPIVLLILTVVLVMRFRAATGQSRR